MDLLKTALETPEECFIGKNTIKIKSKEVPVNKVFLFPFKTEKSYSVGDLIFYLKNSKLNVDEYKKKSQKEGFSCVDSNDALKIKKLLQNPNTKLEGDFINTNFRMEKPFEIINDKVGIILVANYLGSKLHGSNTETLIKTGIISEAPFDPLIQRKETVNVSGMDVEIRGDGNMLTDEQLKCVIGVFVDSIESSKAFIPFSKLPLCCSIFSLVDDHALSVKVLDKNNSVENQKKIIDALGRIINSWL